MAKPPRALLDLLPPDELLRCQVIALLRSKLDAGMAVHQAVAEVAAQKHFLIQTGEMATTTARSVRRWWSSFQVNGWAGLRTRRRTAPQTYPALPEKLVEFLCTEKKLDRYASVPELLRRARALEVIAADQKYDRVTVWRACTRLGLPLRRVPGKREIDSRRFAYPHRLQMVLADGKHFRAGPCRNKRLVLFLLRQ